MEQLAEVHGADYLKAAREVSLHVRVVEIMSTLFSQISVYAMNTSI